MKYDAIVYEGEVIIHRQPFTAASDEETEEKMKGVTPFFYGSKTVGLFRQDGEHWTHVSSWSVNDPTH